MRTGEVLESPKNPRIRDARRLRERRERERTGRFLVEGRRELARAVARGLAAEVVFHLAEGLDAEEAGLLEELVARGAEAVPVGPRARGALAYRDPPEGGLVAVAPTPGVALGDLEPAGDGPLLVVEGCEKPGNLGALLRSADGAGAGAVIACGASVDLGNPNLVRASLGTLFALPVARAGTAETLAWLEARGARVVVTSPDAPGSYFEADLTGEVAIVLGSEHAGLADAWFGRGATEVALPMLGIADSLNLAQTGSILLYEALRQRRA